MSPTFTEPAAAGRYPLADDEPQSARPRFSSGNSFQRTFALVVTGLVVLVAVFAGLNYLQGPKLSSGQVDGSRVVDQPGQQLRLFANQTIRAVGEKQVTISPAAPFTVQTTGAVIALQFTDRLRYDTNYSVTVHGVTNSYQPRPTTFSYNFQTAGATFFYLDRAKPDAGGEQLDSIIRTEVRGNARTVIYQARHIQQFAVFPRAIAVAALGEDNTSSLSLVGIDNGFVESIRLPGTGTVEQLQSAPDHDFLGFVFTSTRANPDDIAPYTDALMTVDLAGTHLVAPVLGLGNKPYEVTNWLFLNGGTKIVGHQADQTVLLMDAANPGTAVPLGQFTALGSGSPDGTHIVVSDLFGPLSYDISDASKLRLPSLPMAGASTYGGDLRLVGHGDERIQQVAVFGAEESRRFQSFLVHEEGKNLRVLFQTIDDQGSIEGFSVSPNGQYVAVNVIPDFASSVSDGYPTGAQSTSISTVIVEISTGLVVRSVAGFGESW